MEDDDVDADAAENVLAGLPVAALVLRDDAVAAANADARTLLGGDPAGRPLEATLTLLASRAPDARDGWTARARTEAGGVVELRAGGPGPDGTRLVVLIDVTAEVRAEAIVAAVGDSTMVLTSDGIVKWQAGEVEALADEGHGGVGTNPLELVHPEDLPRVLDTFVRAVGRPGRRFEVVARSHAPGEGHWMEVELTGVYLPRVPGVEGIVSQVRNAGSGRHIDSLADDGEFLSLTDAAPVGLVMGDLFGRTVYSNPEARRLLGITAEAIAAGTDWVERLASEVDRAAVRASIDAAVYEGKAHTHIVRLVVDGASRWLRLNVTPRTAGGRQAVGLITTFDDVTVEIEARAEADRLMEMLDASSDFVVVFRPGGEVLYANPAYRRLLGIGTDSALTGDPATRPRLSSLIPEDVRATWLEQARKVIATEDVWRGEFDFQSVAGERLPVSALVVVRRDPQGGVDWVSLLARDISELKEAEHRLREVAAHDHLTGLPNRMLFTDRLEQAVARHHRTRQGLAVLFCDLDGFKEINDTYGHATGDELLVAVAHRLREIVRESDTAARVGGDEFVVVAEGVTDTDVLATLAERIIESVSARMVSSTGVQLRVGISVGIGVALPRNADVKPDALLTLADSAMYKAKARGGNRYQIAPLSIG